MATVTENYKIAVEGARPNAALRYIIKFGSRFYRVVDGDEVLADMEISPMIAWREAERQLCN